MRNPLKFLFMCFSVAGLLSGCAVHNPKMWETAKFPKATPATSKLRSLPPAGQKVAIAVYGFTDQTGQFKPTDGAQTLSRAVTQGATSILVKSLHEAGRRSWFTVIEREKLDNVLRERAVIREMRASYLGEKTINPQALPPLLFAGVLLEGGIIGYDSNTKTGGSGARFLGIGGQTQYREDTVTVYLRAVSVKTGEVLSSVSMRKSIASIGVGASAFRFVAFRELLELESGISYNEPDQLALQQTIEAAVYALIMEGAMQDLWCFNTSDETANSMMRSYLSDRDSVSESKVQLAVQRNGMPLNGTCKAAQSARARPANNGQLTIPARVRQTQSVSQAPQVARAPQPTQARQKAEPVIPVPAAKKTQQPEPVAAIPPTIVKMPTRSAISQTTKTSPPVTMTPAISKTAAKVVPVRANATPVQSSKTMASTRTADVSVAVNVPVEKPAAAQISTTNVAQNAVEEDCSVVMLAPQPLPEGYTPSVPDPNGCEGSPKKPVITIVSVDKRLRELGAEVPASDAVTAASQTSGNEKSPTASLQKGANME